MAASKVDLILEADASGALFRREDGSTYRTDLADLRKPALQAAVRFRFGQGLPNWATLEDMRQALRSGVLPTGPTAPAPVPTYTGPVAEPAPAPAPAAAFPNRFPGTCHVCGLPVAKGQGLAIRPPTPADKWAVACGQAHLAAEPVTTEPTPEPAPVPVQVATPATPGGLDALVAGIAAEAAAQALEGASVNEAQVEAIVARTVAPIVERHLAKVPPLRVRVNEDRDLNMPPMAHEALARLVARLAIPAPVKYPSLVGPAGTGKSTIAEQAAEALGLEARSMSLSADMMRQALFGFVSPVTGDYVGTAFREAYEHGHLFVLDEVDKGHPNILAGLNQALANGGVTFPDGYVKRHEAFRCVTTANTYGRGPDRQYVGSNILDAAFLDRFYVLEVDYDRRLERHLALAQSTEDRAGDVEAWCGYVWACRERVMSNKAQVIVGTRAIVWGAQVLAATPPDVSARQVAAECAAETFLAGLAPDSRDKVDAGLDTYFGGRS